MSKQLFFKSFREIMTNYNDVVVVSHVNPDGDAVGSTLALSFFLRKLGVNVNVVLPNDFPSFLSWIPGIEDVIIFDKDSEKAVELFNNADLFFFLDFNMASRTGLMHNDLCHCKNTPKILIDHHLSPDKDAFLACLSEEYTSSTSELVAELIDYHGFDYYMDDDIATCLLVGIMTDTGSFAHSIYHPYTFEVCGKLMSSTLNYPLIHRMVYDNSSENRLRLLGYSISNKMIVKDEYNTAFITLSKDELDSFDYKVGDTEGIVNYPLSISDVKMSVLLTERQGIIRLSFRSKGDFSVHELAKKYFSGGGHTNAAGGTLDCSLEQAVEKLVSILPEYKTMLNK